VFFFREYKNWSLDGVYLFDVLGFFDTADAQNLKVCYTISTTSIVRTASCFTVKIAHQPGKPDNGTSTRQIQDRSYAVPGTTIILRTLSISLE
jgi:hypothetical protein